jgi:hypothetical protein
MVLKKKSRLEKRQIVRKEQKENERKGERENWKGEINLD